MGKHHSLGVSLCKCISAHWRGNVTVIDLFEDKSKWFYCGNIHVIHKHMQRKHRHMNLHVMHVSVPCLINTSHYQRFVFLVPSSNTKYSWKLKYKFSCWESWDPWEKHKLLEAFCYFPHILWFISCSAKINCSTWHHNQYFNHIKLYTKTFKHL